MIVWPKGIIWNGFRLRVLRIFLLLTIGFVGLRDAAAATTHYISTANGSDSNNGTSTTTAWAHLPGMLGCSSKCSSYTPAPGDQFILRGGDTWGAADLGGVNLSYNGTSGSPIYIGVDQSWFAGSSWTRPIWSCQNTNCGDNSATWGNVVWMGGNYLTLDNIEITGYQYDGASGIIGTYGNYDTVENMYIHGWSRTAGSCGSGTNDPFAISMAWSNYNGEGTGNLVLNNVIDGSDSSDVTNGLNYCFGGILHGATVRGNVIRYVYDGMNGLFNVIDGNLVEYDHLSSTGDHCNMIYPQNIFQGSTLIVTNNVVRHSGCAGGTTIFTMANSSCPTCTSYLFNNVLYDNETNSDKGFSAGGPNSNGTFYFYNDTVDTPGGACIQNGSSGTETVHYENFHCVSPTVCNLSNGTCINDGGTLQQSEAQADANVSTHYDQYTASETYAYSPVASTNSTVAAGNNLTSLCSGNLAALCSDTTYATYDTTNHTVVQRTVNSRPTSGTWDIGAYEYAATDQPNAPTGLTAVVQ